MKRLMEVLRQEVSELDCRVEHGANAEAICHQVAALMKVIAEIAVSAVRRVT